MPCWGAAMDGPTLMVMGERIGEVPPVDGVASVMIGGIDALQIGDDKISGGMGLKSAICELSMTIMWGNGHFLILPIELSGRLRYGCSGYHRRVDSSAGP